MKVKKIFLIITFAIVFVISGLTMSVLNTGDKVDAVVTIPDHTPVTIVDDEKVLPAKPTPGKPLPSSPSTSTGSWANPKNTEEPQQDKEDGAYIIDSEKKLAYLINNVADFNGKTVKLDKNLDMSAHPWEPIGSVDTPYYNGTFDGQNHTITGLNVSDKDGYAGLFGVADRATIKNLIVVGGTFSSNNYSGSIVAKASRTTFSNILVNKCTINSNSSGTNAYSGGIVGSQTFGAIRECIVNDSNVRTSCSVNKAGDSSNDDIMLYSGGVAGLSSAGIVTSCIKGDSSVTSTFAENSFNEKHTNYAYCGGIAGFSITGIDTCYNDAEEVRAISINKNADGLEYNGIAYAGGIAGFTGFSSIKNCFNKSSIYSSAPRYCSAKEEIPYTTSDWILYYNNSVGEWYEPRYTYKMYIMNIGTSSGVFTTKTGAYSDIKELASPLMYMNNQGKQDVNNDIQALASSRGGGWSRKYYNTKETFSTLAFSGGIVGYADSYSNIYNNYNSGTIGAYGGVELNFTFHYKIKREVTKLYWGQTTTTTENKIAKRLIYLQERYFAGNIVGGINDEKMQYSDFALNYYTQVQKENLATEIRLETSIYLYKETELGVLVPETSIRSKTIPSHYPECSNSIGLGWFYTLFDLAINKTADSKGISFDLKCKYKNDYEEGSEVNLGSIVVDSIPNYTRIEGYSDEKPYVYLDRCGSVGVDVATLDSENKNIWAQDDNINLDPNTGVGLPYLTDFYW